MLEEKHFQKGDVVYIWMFSTAPPPPKSFEVKEVDEKREFTYRIILNAGFLQGVVEGMYYIYDTTGFVQVMENLESHEI